MLKFLSHKSPSFEPYQHQKFTANFYQQCMGEGLGTINTSDCGTGKTGGVLLFLSHLYDAGWDKKVLVLAPLSILQPAWGADIEKFTHNVSYSLCYAKNRRQAFEKDAKIYITNHDAIKWLALKENSDILEKFKDGIIVIDEFTAYKNPDAQRTKAAVFVSGVSSMVIELSGTPRPRSVLDMWVPAFLVDRGKRLGNRYYAFRARMCVPEQVGKDPRAKRWVEKIGANSEVTNLLKDISIRFAASECQDLPPNRKRYIEIELPAKALRAYKDMEKADVMFSESGEMVSAINAAARNQKLLQLCTGAVYDQTGKVVSFHKERYQLVLDLIREVDSCLVGFNWRHERDEIERLLDSWNASCSADERISYAHIDGSVSNIDVRNDLVKEFQAGRIRVLICHPQSAGHGLTLTRGVRTIWCSATNNAEHFIQFNHRIDRAGQSRETETIMIAAKGTREVQVYKNMVEGKIRTQNDMLRVFAGHTLSELNKFTEEN